jgi:hypothetical protein
MAENNAAQGLINLSRKGSPNNGSAAYSPPSQISSQPVSTTGVDKVWFPERGIWFTPISLNLSKKNGSKRKSRKNRKTRKSRKNRK